jgi:hypothetical protein
VGRRNVFIVGVVVGALVGGAAVAVAAIPDTTTGVISSCLKVKDGTVRIIDAQAGKRCSKEETLLAWNKQGPEGPAGATGPAGPAGAPGATGPAGPVGPVSNCNGFPHADIDWHGCDLHGANLSGAHLGGANLTGANLAGADLSNADLTNANLTSADLTSANLSGSLRTGIVWSATTCTDGTTSDVTPNCAVVEAISEVFSSSSIYLGGGNYVWWTITLHDPNAMLPGWIFARLCPPDVTSPQAAYCTGATLYQSGNATDASYTALFIVSAGAPLGNWKPYYWFGNVNRWGASRVTLY